ncbi:uncharacterized protein LOC107636782 [Arachis ipaensis]|uniref:uncharacterized protein LOC107636782 n=1 Tax=Arachis ipaensis TaxID=130454 RepID=UPI0007AF189F|nr:uncharacterized protein LOC107636782 [Arachis ipaensis]
MASQFTLLKDIDPSFKNQVYKIKVRLIKSWSLTYSELKYQKPMIELVVIDEMGDRIQCTIRNPLRRLFEGELSDDKVYTISNFSLSLNDQKYKTTNHSHYVIGLPNGKGDTIEFIRNDKSCVYIVVELDDMKDNGKIRCTLWEEYAKMLVKHIEDQPTSEYIIIIQFAKFNLFKGSTSVSNTNCNSILYINTDFSDVKDFRKSVIMNGTYVTHGTVVAIDYKSGWWYKSYKHFFHALKEYENSFHYATCDTFPNSHYKFKSCYEFDTTSFILYDKEASKYLSVSASHMRLSHVNKIVSDFENLVHENSELIIILSDSTETFKGLIEAVSCTKSLINIYPDSENQSSTKSRKITVEEVHNVAKLHEE